MWFDSVGMRLGSGMFLMSFSGDSDVDDLLLFKKKFMVTLVNTILVPQEKFLNE